MSWKDLILTSFGCDLAVDADAHLLRCPCWSIFFPTNITLCWALGHQCSRLLGSKQSLEGAHSNNFFGRRIYVSAITHITLLVIILVSGWMRSWLWHTCITESRQAIQCSSHGYLTLHNASIWLWYIPPMPFSLVVVWWSSLLYLLPLHSYQHHAKVPFSNTTGPQGLQVGTVFWCICHNNNSVG